MKSLLMICAMAGLLLTTNTFASLSQLNEPSEPGPADPPMPLDGTWVRLIELMITDVFFTGTYTWNSPLPVEFTITDWAVVSDRFEVYDFNSLVATTPLLPDWDELGIPNSLTSPPWTVYPDVALADGRFSSAVINFAAGAHSITIRDIHIPLNSLGGVPFTDGTVAFKAVFVPEPATVCLLGLSGLALFRYKMKKEKDIVLRIVIVFVLCCLLLAGSVYADTTWMEKQKLHAADGAAGDWFGHSVSISDDYAIVGAHWDDDKGTDSGSAYIFKREGETWLQQQKLTAADGAAGDCFGHFTFINGDYAIVGAHWDDDKGTDSGSAYIFKRDGETWLQRQKLTATDGAAGDNFGFSASISGDYIIVGAYGDNDNGSDSGSAYIFKRYGETWLQQQKLTAADGAAGDCFGTQISTCGDYAIIGARYGDGNVADSGSAYIFKRDGTIWSQQAKLLASDGAAGDEFGYGVSMGGDYALVGSWLDDDNGTDSGSAYVFKREGTAWLQQAKLLASDGVAGDRFGGCQPSINDDYAVVGANLDDDNGTDSGSVYIFKRDGETWSQQQKLITADGAAGDVFGYFTSMSGDYIIVGAYYDDDNGVDSGSAYIFGPPISVTIDIRPGNVPVVILSSATFDATTIDRSTVEFAGAHPLPNYCSQLGEIPEDVDGDGLLDIVFYFKALDLDLPLDDMEVCLTGRIFGGQEFKGCNSICRLGPVIGDLNNDGTIDFRDFAEFALRWLDCTNLNCN